MGFVSKASNCYPHHKITNNPDVVLLIHNLLTDMETNHKVVRWIIGIFLIIAIIFTFYYLKIKSSNTEPITETATTTSEVIIEEEEPPVFPDTPEGELQRDLYRMDKENTAPVTEAQGNADEAEIQKQLDESSPPSNSADEADITEMLNQLNEMDEAQ